MQMQKGYTESVEGGASLAEEEERSSVEAIREERAAVEKCDQEPVRRVHGQLHKILSLRRRDPKTCLWGCLD